MNLQPLGDRLIVEVLDEEEQTVSGIVLPDTAKEKPQRGRVLAVGPGGRDEDGKHIPMDVAEDDEIIFSKYGGTEIKVGTDEVLILRESDVLAKVIGDIVVTHKDDNLHGIKLMVLQPLAPDGSAIGRTLVAVDAVGAGVGETVFFVRGKEASFPFHPTEVPTDAGIVGIVDEIDLG